MPKKVLIVEDEGPILRLLAEQFRKNGFEALEAKDGEKGLEMAQNSQPDFIILDLFMPRMDGVTMLKKLRGSGEWGTEVPVTVITNFLTKVSREEVLAYNIYSFIVKTDLKLPKLI